MTIGDVDAWTEVFPDDLVPAILDLILTTWTSFQKPSPDEREVPLTRRFRCALKQAKDYSRLPVRIDREPAEDDLMTTQELGRIDLRFSPAGSALEEVYFAFECKRLNAMENGTRRPRAAEYVTEGMMRFVTGKYGRTMRHGGMLGYVLDGRCDEAMRLVSDNITLQAALLLMDDPPVVARSRLKPTVDYLRETGHNLPPSRRFALHHVFLECAAAPSSPINGPGLAADDGRS